MTFANIPNPSVSRVVSESLPHGSLEAVQAALDLEVLFSKPQSLERIIFPLLGGAESFSQIGIDPANAAAAHQISRIASSLSPATESVRAKTLETIKTHFRDPSIAHSAAALVDYTIGDYLQFAQYHTAEHMLTVVGGAQTLAALCPQMDERAKLRLVISAAYHDSGNRKLPGAPGVDELGAISIFLDDVAKARKGLRTDSLPGNVQELLCTLTAQDIVRICANIGGTVFRDRLCSADELEKQPYLHAISSMLAHKSSDLGLNDWLTQSNANRTLAAFSVSTESMVLKNADLLGSLTPEDFFKNHVTNRYEDREKPFARGSTDAAAYYQNFLNFVEGSFHILAHPDDLASPSFLQALQHRLDPAVKQAIAFESLSTNKAVEKVLAVFEEELAKWLVGTNMPAPVAHARSEEVCTNLRLFSRNIGWNPAVLVGAGEAVAQYGNEQLEAQKPIAEQAFTTQETLFRALHELINKGVAVPRLDVAQIRDELLKSKVDLSQFPKLQEPGPEWIGVPFAYIPGVELNSIFLAR